MKAKIVALWSLLLILTSCESGQVFPDEPYLEYRSYTLVEADVDPDVPFDHARVELFFTDGDGNIGEREFGQAEFNFLVSVFEKHDTEYIYAYDWSALLKDIADDGQQNQAMEATIFYKLGVEDATTDTVRFEFELIDDDGNSSGVVTSEDVYLTF